MRCHQGSRPCSSTPHGLVGPHAQTHRHRERETVTDTHKHTHTHTISCATKGTRPRRRTLRPQLDGTEGGAESANVGHQLQQCVGHARPCVHTRSPVGAGEATAHPPRKCDRHMGTPAYVRATQRRRMHMGWCKGGMRVREAHTGTHGRMRERGDATQAYK
jgi:hypothetical protein